MVTGFVLAGGRSSRMAPPPGGGLPSAIPAPSGPAGGSPTGGGVGRDKALLTVGQWLLIELVIERIRPHVERVIVIGNRENRSPLLDLEVEAVLTDFKPGYGPLMGIYTGLMVTKTPLNLFVPCDMPWVEERLIERLVSACVGSLHVVASWHPVEGLQPFPLVCHLNACRTIGTLLDQGQRSLHQLLRHPSATRVQINEPELWRSFTNVNTLEDYAKLHDEVSLTH